MSIMDHLASIMEKEASDESNWGSKNHNTTLTKQQSNSRQQPGRLTIQEKQALFFLIPNDVV